MAELPYRYTVGQKIGQGAHRYVIGTNWNGRNAVVKRTTNRIDMMRSEIEFWERVKNTPLRKHFAEVYDYDRDGYTWTIMERLPKVLAHVSDDEWRATRDQVEEVRQIGQDLGLFDLHNANIGIRDNGEVTILDYAM